MRFELLQSFCAPIADVEAAFTHPEILAHLNELPHVGRPEFLDQQDLGDTVNQRVRYRFVGRLSPAVTAVVDPARLSWVQESVLERESHHTRVSIHPDHYPDRLRCKGLIRLTEVDGRTYRSTEAELTVSLPLFASSVERAIVAGLREHAAAEAAAVQRWLDERRPDDLGSP